MGIDPLRHARPRPRVTELTLATRPLHVPALWASFPRSYGPRSIHRGGPTGAIDGTPWDVNAPAEERPEASGDDTAASRPTSRREKPNSGLARVASRPWHSGRYC